MSDSTTHTRLFLSDRNYDRLKWVAQILLPALGTLYFTLSTIWGLPNAEEIVGTITAVDLFLGLLLGLSTQQYKSSGARFDGEVGVVEEEGVARPARVSFDGDGVDLASKKELVLKVTNDLEY